MSKEYKGYRDLIVYQKSYTAALGIYELSKTFSVEEKYSLTDQIRRSSRSIPANISEGWRKRKYPKIFSSRNIRPCTMDAKIGISSCKERFGQDCRGLVLWKREFSKG